MGILLEHLVYGVVCEAYSSGSAGSLASCEEAAENLGMWNKAS